MASGDPLFAFTMNMGEPPASFYSTPDTRNASNPAPDIDAIVLDFAGTQKEYMDFPGLMPGFYSGGGITLALGFSMSAAAAPNQVRLGAAFASWTPDIQAWSNWDFATARESSVICPSGAHGGTEGIILFTNAQAAAILANEWFRLRVYRDPTFVGPPADDAAGDLELMYVRGVET